MPRTLKIYLTWEAQSSQEEVSSLAPTPLVLAEHPLHPGGHSPVSPVPEPTGITRRALPSWGL